MTNDELSQELKSIQNKLDTTLNTVSVDIATVKGDIRWLKTMMFLFISPIAGSIITIAVQYLLTGKP